MKLKLTGKVICEIKEKIKNDTCVYVDNYVDLVDFSHFFIKKMTFDYDRYVDNIKLHRVLKTNSTDLVNAIKYIKYYFIDEK